MNHVWLAKDYFSISVGLTRSLEKLKWWFGFLLNAMEKIYLLELNTVDEKRIKAWPRRMWTRAIKMLVVIWFTTSPGLKWTSLLSKSLLMPIIQRTSILVCPPKYSFSGTYVRLHHREIVIEEKIAQHLAGFKPTVSFWRGLRSTAVQQPLCYA